MNREIISFYTLIIIYILNSIKCRKYNKSNNELIKVKGGFTMLEEYPDVLSINETMGILGISRNLLYNLIHTGVIPAMRIGKNCGGLINRL